jgi:hypothetical protein
MGHQQAAETADLIMRRADYYAGQIDVAARDRIEEAMRSAGVTASGRAPTPAPSGSLQRTVLRHSLRIHTIRQEAIPEHLHLQQYRLAMQADERREVTHRRHVREQANKAAAALAAAGAGGVLPSGPPAVTAATAPDDDADDDDDDNNDK